MYVYFKIKYSIEIQITGVKNYMEKLILIGAGGYAKSVIDSIDYFNYTLEGFVDEFSKYKDHLGYPILAHSLEELGNYRKYVYFICIGNNQRRKVWFDRLVERKLRIINVVDRSAIVSERATIGMGCFVGKMAILNSNSYVGNNCIINTKALIEHGCIVGNHVNISTNTVLNGDVKIGEGSFIGSSSVIIGQLSVGLWSTVGAGAVVTKNVVDDVSVAGVPARVIRKGAMLG